MENVEFPPQKRHGKSDFEPNSLLEENGLAKEVRWMLCGEYKHAIDAKNRLFIPAKYREQLGESFIVIRGSEGDERFLTVYSQDEWKEIEAKLA